MKKFENRILKDLFESVNGLFAFTFYSRYKVEPKELYEFIEKYTTKQLVNYENDRLKLTDKGREIVFTRIYFDKNLPGKFANIPKDFLSKKIEINQPYLPKLNYLSPEILGIER